MRLGRLQTSHWHATYHTLHSDKCATIKLSDLMDLEVAFNPDPKQNRHLIDTYSPCALLTDIIQSNGKWALSEGDMHHDLVDQFMLLIDQCDPVGHEQPEQRDIQQVNATGSHLLPTTRHNSSSLAVLARQLSNLDLQPLLTCGNSVAVLSRQISQLDMSGVAVLSNEFLNAFTDPLACPDEHGLEHTQSSDNYAGTDESAFPKTHEIPSTPLIVELSSILESHTVEGETPEWPDYLTTPSEIQSRKNHVFAPTTQNSSQSTLLTSDSFHPTTTTDMLLESSTESPVLSVQQMHYLLTTCFDSTFGTRIVEQVVHPDHVDVSARALRSLVPKVSLRHLSQVIHWMCAKESERSIHPEDSGELGLKLGPGWPIVSIAKLLMILTFDWTCDVAGVFLGYVTQSWPARIHTQLVSMLVHNEAPSLAALFIKSATWSWTLIQVSELISVLDCTLQWSEAYFTRLIHLYLDIVQRDAHFVPTCCSKPGRAEPAAVSLARDETTRLFFITALYRTSVSVHQFRLDAIKKEAGLDVQQD